MNRYEVTIERTITQKITHVIEASSFNGAEAQALTDAEKIAHWVDLGYSARDYRAAVITPLEMQR
jgi:hypothetical protein